MTGTGYGAALMGGLGFLAVGMGSTSVGPTLDAFNSGRTRSSAFSLFKRSAAPYGLALSGCKAFFQFILVRPLGPAPDC